MIKYTSRNLIKCLSRSVLSVMPNVSFLLKVEIESKICLSFYSFSLAQSRLSYMPVLLSETEDTGLWLFSPGFCIALTLLLILVTDFYLSNKGFSFPSISFSRDLCNSSTFPYLRKAVLTINSTKCL